MSYLFPSKKVFGSLSEVRGNTFFDTNTSKYLTLYDTSLFLPKVSFLLIVSRVFSECAVVIHIFEWCFHAKSWLVRISLSDCLASSAWARLENLWLGKNRSCRIFQALQDLHHFDMVRNQVHIHIERTVWSSSCRKRARTCQKERQHLLS